MEEPIKQTDPDDDWKMAILEQNDVLKKINGKLNFFVALLIVALIFQFLNWILR